MTLPREGAKRGAVEGHMSIMSGGEAWRPPFLSGRNSSCNNLPAAPSRLDWTVSQDGEAGEDPAPAHCKEGPRFLQSPRGVGSQEMLDQQCHPTKVGRQRAGGSFPPGGRVWACGGISEAAGISCQANEGAGSVQPSLAGRLALIGIQPCLLWRAAAPEQGPPPQKLPARLRPLGGHTPRGAQPHVPPPPPLPLFPPLPPLRDAFHSPPQNTWT